MFTKFSYRITYLFLFWFCWRLTKCFYMFYMGDHLYHIDIYIDGITCYVMLESLSIHDLWFGAFKIVNLDCTRVVDFFNVIRFFPFGKQFTWRNPETRLVRQNFITNIKLSFQNPLIMPLLYLFFEHFCALISFTSPLI